MNTSWNRGVESPAGFIVSYAQREYNSIRTHIKGMINVVNPIAFVIPEAGVKSYLI